LIATAGSNGLYLSLNQGENWIEVDIINRNWQKAVLSESGNVMIAIAYDGYIYMSVDDWKVWKLSLCVPHDMLLDICMNQSGDQIFVISAEGTLYHSSDYGNSWQVRYSSPNGFEHIACNDIGSHIILASNIFGLVSSNTFGKDWEELVAAPRVLWKSLSLDASGQHILGIAEDDSTIYSSNNFGVSWTTLFLPSIPLNKFESSLASSTELHSRNSLLQKVAYDWKDVDYLHSQFQSKLQFIPIFRFA
jgi:photosystem II stability/assembly factor-like uncharacterized protein